MEREDTIELVELGAVSTETQGVKGQFSDGEIALPQAGLSDD